MSEYEKQRLTEIVSSMDGEEFQIVLLSIPSEYMFDELKRRDSMKTDMLSGIVGVITG